MPKWAVFSRYATVAFTLSLSSSTRREGNVNCELFMLKIITGDVDGYFVSLKE